MINHPRRSEAKEFIVATETGILHRMRKENPDKTFYPVKEDAVCRYMKMITLDKVLTSLQNEVYEVNVPEEVAVRAKKAIDRMLEISAN
jgi:quinolinate synthase